MRWGGARTSDGAHVGRRVLLEEQLERVDVVELDAADAAREALGHGLVAADVHVLDVVELRVRRLADVEVVLLRLVVVHLTDGYWLASLRYFRSFTIIYAIL